MQYQLLESLISSGGVEDVNTMSANLAKEVQAKLKDGGYYSGDIDGEFGTKSKAAFSEFKSTHFLNSPDKLGASAAKSLLALSNTITGDDLASKIIRRMQALGFKVFKGRGEVNLIYLEGVNADGTPNSDRLDEFNDRRILLVFENNKPKIIGNYLGSSEIGAYYTYNRMNPLGGARIAIDAQFTAWAVGYHGYGNSEHEALVQVGEVTVCRDDNEDGMRTGDYQDTGYFGINYHSAFDSENVGRWSAGCLIVQSHADHQESMELLKRDPRYLSNPDFIFTIAILDGQKL